MGSSLAGSAQKSTAFPGPTLAGRSLGVARNDGRDGPDSAGAGSVAYGRHAGRMVGDPDGDVNDHDHDHCAEMPRFAVGNRIDPFLVNDLTTVLKSGSIGPPFPCEFGVDDVRETALDDRFPPPVGRVPVALPLVAQGA